jgi:hypothetical protein
MRPDIQVTALPANARRSIGRAPLRTIRSPVVVRRDAPVASDRQRLQLMEINSSIIIVARALSAQSD